MSAEPRYFYVHADASAAEAESVSSLLWDLGAQGIEERDASTLVKNARDGVTTTLVASFEDEARARAAGRRVPKRFHPRIDIVVGDAWRDAWRAHFKPTRLGKRLVVRPSWEPYARKARDVVLVLDPGRAFGTGTHESTRLVLAELDRRVRGGERVLDVGCGSGILSVAALLLGAKSAVAVDVDPDAVEVTRENAELNGVGRKMRASTTDVGKVRGTYELVLANIQADVLALLAPALRKRVARGGTLVLSGVLVGQERALLDTFAPMRKRAAHVEGEWIALTLAG